MEGDTVSLINTYSLPTGRRSYAMAEIARRAVEVGAAAVATHAARAVAHDRTTLEMEHQRYGERRRLYGERAISSDQEVDQWLMGMEAHLDAQVSLFGVDSPRGGAAAQLRRALFPKGAYAIAQLPFVQEHVEVSQLLARLAQPELAGAVSALPELTEMTARLVQLNEAYRRSLEDYDRPVSGEALRAARARGHELLAETIALILAHYVVTAPEDRQGRAYLLEPILRQNRALREARQRRRAPADVDPVTGEAEPDGDNDIDGGSDSDVANTSGSDIAIGSDSDIDGGSDNDGDSDTNSHTDIDADLELTR